MSNFGSGRTVERSVGCWNCKHWAPEAGIAYWLEARQARLTQAVSIAISSPQGEQDIRVENIRNMVMKLDIAMAEKPPLFGLCMNAKAKEQDKLGDLIASVYLCTSGWSGATGASLARAGGKLDKTAAELIEDLDGAEAVEIQGLNK